MPRERILVTVKTYPTLSRKYGETVCTAGVRPNGTWVRIYPVPFRRLDEAEQYRKFDWLECGLTRNTSDRRPESFRPIGFSELQPIGHLGTKDGWHERRRLLLKTAQVFTHLQELIDAAKANQLSLAVFKPAEVLDFAWEEEEDREWSIKQLHEMRAQMSQPELFEDNSWRETFKLIPKLPYSFSYKFRDASGKESRMRVLDWEVGGLFWNCRRDSSGNEQEALRLVRKKYFDAFLKTDLHFFLGTTLQFHSIGPNPWVIIGVFPIPHSSQSDLFD